MLNQKTVIAVNDISCMGRCSLTVALPILSAEGLETVILPTAVLSTHTGGFTGYTFNDMTDDMPKISAHWKTLGRKYSAIFTGYLGSFKQLAEVEDVIKNHKTDETLVMIDPVMGDNGKLYSIFDDKYVAGMRKFCETNADVITPNVTEACGLAGISYVEGPYDSNFVADLIEKLIPCAKKAIIITGLMLKGDKTHIYSAMYVRETGKTILVKSNFVKGSFHGAGDVFSSVLLGEILKGKSLNFTKKALQKASDFTELSIKETKRILKGDYKYGICFEGVLKTL